MPAALKVLKEGDGAPPEARPQFVREAEALAALRHPAIVRVLGITEDTRRGLLGLLMELALGETLRERIHRGPMGVAEALGVFTPAGVRARTRPRGRRRPPDGSRPT